MKYNSTIASALLFASQLAVIAQNSLPPDQFRVLTREHTDGLCILYDSAGSNLLSLVSWERDAELDLPTNQVILVAKAESKVILPAGTPFGNAGQPLWILPQSQNVNLLYLGINSGRVPDGVFEGSFTIVLKHFEGPGYFIAWQATGPGQYNIRMDTRDGVDTNDVFQPLPGAHEHFNWGFSSTGVYSATFQASGRRIGESTNISSLESTFVFHVQPLPSPTNYPTWAKGYWPPGFNPPTTLTNGNPDGDLFDNLHEYAFNLSPTNANDITNAPLFSFINTNAAQYGALTFTRYKPAADLIYEPVVRAALESGAWTPLTNVAAVTDTGATETVTVRDDQSTSAAPQRFYQLKVKLIP
jgi:surface-anchored protein